MSNTAHEIKSGRVPAHVAIIMDGNGRWAVARGLDRSEGHVEGVHTVRRITEEASKLGVKYLTLYAFSTENWNRPKEEVDALMHLIGIAIEREAADLIRNNVRLNLIGDLDRLPSDALARLNDSVQRTSGCTGLVLSLALSYSARWEIAHAASLIAADAIAGKVNPTDVDTDLFAGYLNTASMPDPDLLIRTGGDYRVSNFLLWQIAYSELVFSPVFWPEYTAEHFRLDIAEFQRRERRFGKTSGQIAEENSES